MPEIVVFSVLPWNPDGNLKWQGKVSQRYDNWDLNSVTELSDHIINLNIILIRILRKIS